MTKMVPADKTTISSTGSLLRVFIYCLFRSYCWVWCKRYIYIYTRTRFAEIYWYNNNNNNNNNNINNNVYQQYINKFTETVGSIKILWLDATILQKLIEK